MAIYEAVFLLYMLQHSKQCNNLLEIHSASENFKDQRRGVSKIQPVQVLLMLIQHGANGLNLLELEAQEVILVEPLLNLAAEAQAISRIHRVGQDEHICCSPLYIYSRHYVLFSFI
jgi:hypothetical protein